MQHACNVSQLTPIKRERDAVVEGGATEREERDREWGGTVP